MTDQLFETPSPMTERAWQTIYQNGLKREGWAWQHVFRTRVHDGSWRTSTTATGWPDIAAFRNGWVLGSEMKKDPKGKPTPVQLDWLLQFAMIPTGRAWVLRPTDSWQEIANWLHRPETAPRVYGWAPPASAADALALAEQQYQAINQER